ncbi:MAG: DsbA family protein [Gaiellaceae bacterium]|jgi:predicted DsbA family dithiol-disulfide isomerase
MTAISVTVFSDPGCPWAYSVSPSLRVLEWRYGEQLDWRLVLIGLVEQASQYAERGYTPLRAAQSQAHFRRYGMPFAPQPKERTSATARACRAVVAARLLEPGSEWRVFRALQLANFTTPLLLDDDVQIAETLRQLPGVDADAIVARLDDQDVSDAYERDKAEARSAAGSAAELQQKTAQTDGPVRFTAPSLVFERDGQRLIAGGFQPIEAYDVLIANLDPGLERQPAPETPAPLLERFHNGLTTQEVAALLVKGNDPADRLAAENALLELLAEGAAIRTPLGDDALWQPAATVGLTGPKEPESAPEDGSQSTPGAYCPIDPRSLGGAAS